MRPARLFILSGLVLALTGSAPAADIRVSVKNAQGAPVEDAVVSLEPVGRTAPPAAAPAAPVEISQEGQEYHPYVTAIQVGTRVNFPNRDKVQHHIYSLSKAKRFEIPLYAPGAHESVVFDQPGVVTLGCNIHDWMLAYLVVLPTPYFAKTEARGTIELPGLPGGRYRLAVWHPRLAAPAVREVTLPDTAGAVTEEFSVTLKPDRRIRRAPEARTGGYN